MKRTEPRKPPRMVSHSVDPSCLLNICIPANTSTDSRLDSTREVPVFTATRQRKSALLYKAFQTQMQFHVHHKGEVKLKLVFTNME